MKGVIFRKDKVVDLCKGKSVLHLGFIQHLMYEDQMKKGDWLHNQIDEVSSSLVGVDYLAEEVEKISTKYKYQCYFGDVMKLEECQVQGTYDVIVCGELIEHIENPGLMLDGVKRFMHKDSILVITTPNPWSLNRIKLMFLKKLENKWLNTEHVSWFSYGTLKQLLERKSYAEIDYNYYYDESVENMRKSKSFINQVKFFFKKILLKMTPAHLYDGLFFQTKLK